MIVRRYHRRKQLKPAGHGSSTNSSEDSANNLTPLVPEGARNSVPPAADIAQVTVIVNEDADNAISEGEKELVM